MKSVFGIVSFLLIFGVVIPYVIDILKGRAKPARSTRILFFVLTITTLVIQSRDFTSWILALTVAEVLVSTILLIFSFRYGLGGLKNIDIASYVMFIIALTGYIVTGEVLLSLVLLCLTDFVAYLPTIDKNFKDPTSDTKLFYIVGVIAPIFSVFAASDYSDINQTIFPAYLVLVNALALFPLVITTTRISKKSKRGFVTPQK